MITQNLLMFEIDETKYYYSARVSFRMFFCTKAMITLENILDGKNLKIQLNKTEKLHQMQIICMQSFCPVCEEQNHLSSRIKFIMNKKTPGALTAGTVEKFFKETIERFASDNEFFFLSSVKGRPAYSKQFLYDKLATIRQLVI